VAGRKPAFEHRRRALTPIPGELPREPIRAARGQVLGVLRQPVLEHGTHTPGDRGCRRRLSISSLSRTVYENGAFLYKHAMQAVETRLQRNPMLPKWGILIRPACMV